MDNESRSADFAADADANFARNLKSAREHAGMSQAELARRVTEHGLQGFHQTTIARIEAATRPLRAAEALALCNVLHMTIEELADTPDDEHIRYLADSVRHRVTVFERALRELAESRRDLAAQIDYWRIRVPRGDDVDGGELMGASRTAELRVDAERVLDDSAPHDRLTAFYNLELDEVTGSFPSGKSLRGVTEGLADEMTAWVAAVEGVRRGKHQAEA